MSACHFSLPSVNEPDNTNTFPVNFPILGHSNSKYRNNSSVSFLLYCKKELTSDDFIESQICFDCYADYCIAEREKESDSNE